jgi:hypothetical protein
MNPEDPKPRFRATVTIHEVAPLQPDVDPQNEDLERQNRNEVAFRISAAIRQQVQNFDKDKDEITVIIEQNDEAAQEVDPETGGTRRRTSQTPTARKK